MEMDCYPEYKHHIHPNHQHYNNNPVATNHPYYGNYGPSMRYTHAQTSSSSAYGESAQQQNYFDGYSRYSHGQIHQHHQSHSHHGNYPAANSFCGGHYGAMRENYHPPSEGSGQYYYNQNAHQTGASYYGNHSYDSYRNASSGYQYGHSAATASHPSQYYSTYSNSPTAEQQFNNRYYPTPSPSGPPTASSSSLQRDPYSHPTSSYAQQSSIENESSEKLNNVNERLSIDNVGDKSASNDPIASSPNVKQSTEHTESGDDSKPEVSQQQTELNKPSPHDSASLNENEKPTAVNENDDDKVDGSLDSEEKESKVEQHKQQQSTSLFNEHRDHNQHHQCNETLPKHNAAISRESSTAAAHSEVENSMATGKNC
jgi:hypothetical protein